MKKVLIMMLVLGVTVGASAQRIGGGFHGGGGYVRPRVTVIAPYAGINPYYGLGYGLGYGYSPFYNPYNSYYRSSRPSQLDFQIEDIKSDYDYQISTVKHDKTLPRDERKQKVRDLKHEKDDAINQAKKDYYNKLDEKRSQLDNSHS